MSEKTKFITPVGRLVAGDLWTARTEDFQGNPLTTKTGANQGQPRQEYFIALAIPKNHPEWPAFRATMEQVAKTGFPNMFDAQGNCLRQNFAWKFVDGDSQALNLNNVRPCDKEGYPGNWVLSMATGIAIGVVDQNLRTILPESKAVKCGDYVRVSGMLGPNGIAQNPGLYVNPSFVQFSHQGEEIMRGMDAATAFGGAALPPPPQGANTNPGPSLQSLDVAQGNPTAPAPVTSTPSPVAAAPTAPVTPAHDFLNPPVTEVEKFAYQGVEYTREQLRGFGWTDAQIDPLPRVGAASAPVAPVVEQFIVEGNKYTREQLRGFGWTDVQIDTQQRA